MDDWSPDAIVAALKGKGLDEARALIYTTEEGEIVMVFLDLRDEAPFHVLKSRSVESFDELIHRLHQSFDRIVLVPDEVTP